MKLLLVDLDDTLIDTTTAKQQLFARLATIYDISLDNVEKIYEEQKHNLATDDWIYDFTMAFDQAVWFSSKDISRLGVTFAVNQVVLDYVKNFSGTKMIFSYGNIKYQNHKIVSCGLDKLFSSIIITPASKYELIRQWVSDNKLRIDGKVFNEVVIMDDNEEFLRKVKRMHSWMTTKLVKDGLI